MTTEPVTHGEFDTGTEWVLWRPGADPVRLRSRALREAVLVRPVPFVLIGLAVITFNPGPVPLGWPWLAAEAVIVGLGGCWAWWDYRCWGHDLRSGRHLASRTDRGNGDLFYRAHDFADLPEHCRTNAELLVTAISEIHREPGTAWLDPDHREHLHRAAWDALGVLIRSAALREPAQFHQQPVAGVGDADAVLSGLGQLDRDVAAVTATVAEAADAVRALNLALCQDTSHRLVGVPVLASVRMTTSAVRDQAAAAVDMIGAAGVPPMIGTMPSQSNGMGNQASR
ncbi:hypothetical protein [Kutzneria albida]|uniref:Uncharacterized protein n=1 Tax=Kutzneria albida DSM 43870 TaxID=1449976 RepID=W5WD89_9PSEU|nr:hypothetical protein [Kutzneria albida]AHH98551.1 hypothetical protein KALB_5189 [Kutzneria albida DSM 43870]